MSSNLVVVASYISYIHLPWLYHMINDDQRVSFGLQDRLAPASVPFGAAAPLQAAACREKSVPGPEPFSSGHGEHDEPSDLS